MKKIIPVRRDPVCIKIANDADQTDTEKKTEYKRGRKANQNKLLRRQSKIFDKSLVMFPQQGQKMAAVTFF